MTLPLTQLRDLVNLLTKSLAVLEQVCAENPTSNGHLAEPTASNRVSESFNEDPVEAEARNVISAAALHICALVNRPELTLFEIVGGPMKAAALRICLESNVVEILREAEPQGLHVDDIAAQNKQDPSVLSACLRYLATYHVFTEITPNIFANNRISSLLDTGKESKELFAQPEQKYENTSGFAAFVSLQLDEAVKSASNVWELCSDPDAVKSGEPSQSAFAKYVGNGKSLWEYYDTPEQAFRRRRFNLAMHGVQKMQPEGVLLSVYDWKNVPSNATIVDVGGGVGTTQMCLARAFPDFTIIVQDRQHVVEEGIKIWQEKYPDAIQSGRVVFEAHDFFSPQPKRDVSFFFMKQILHDWSDKYCCKILSQLRQAASSSTRLLSMDTIIPYACRDDSTNLIPGAAIDEAPSPLLSNWGPINAMGYRAALTMFCQFNAKERTIGDAVALFEQSGWKIVEVHRQKGAQGSFLQCIEAIPI